MEKKVSQGLQGRLTSSSSGQGVQSQTKLSLQHHIPIQRPNSGAPSSRQSHKCPTGRPKETETQVLILAQPRKLQSWAPHRLQKPAETVAEQLDAPATPYSHSHSQKNCLFHLNLRFPIAESQISGSLNLIMVQWWHNNSNLCLQGGTPNKRILELLHPHSLCAP